jgi:hypothetical protein
VIVRIINGASRPGSRDPRELCGAAAVIHVNIAVQPLDPRELCGAAAMIQGEVAAPRRHHGHITAVRRDPREPSGVVAADPDEPNRFQRHDAIHREPWIVPALHSPCAGSFDNSNVSPRCVCADTRSVPPAGRCAGRARYPPSGARVRHLNRRLAPRRRKGQEVAAGGYRRVCDVHRSVAGTPPGPGRSAICRSRGHGQWCSGVPCLWPPICAGRRPTVVAGTRTRSTGTNTDRQDPPHVDLAEASARSVLPMCAASASSP